MNRDSLDGIEVLAAKPQKATGDELVKIINNNTGVVWLTPEVIKMSTIKDCAEIIEERKQHGTVGFKLARAILKLIKEPRNAAEKKTAPRKRAPRKRR